MRSCRPPSKERSGWVPSSAFLYFSLAKKCDATAREETRAAALEPGLQDCRNISDGLMTVEGERELW